MQQLPLEAEGGAGAAVSCSRPGWCPAAGRRRRRAEADARSSRRPATGSRCPATSSTYADFFSARRPSCPYDEKAFEKQLRKPAERAELLGEVPRPCWPRSSRSTRRRWSRLMHEFVAAEGIKIGEIIHAVRVAVDRQGASASGCSTRWRSSAKEAAWRGSTGRCVYWRVDLTAKSRRTRRKTGPSILGCGDFGIWSLGDWSSISGSGDAVPNSRPSNRDREGAASRSSVRHAKLRRPSGKPSESGAAGPLKPIVPTPMPPGAVKVSKPEPRMAFKPGSPATHPLLVACVRSFASREGGNPSLI